MTVGSRQLAVGREKRGNSQGRGKQGSPQRSAIRLHFATPDKSAVSQEERNRQGAKKLDVLCGIHQTVLYHQMRVLK